MLDSQNAKGAVDTAMRIGGSCAGFLPLSGNAGIFAKTMALILNPR